MEYKEKPYNNAHKQWINVTGGHTISPNGSIRLRRRGLPHPDHYPICDQEDETARHIPSFCVFARQFRVSILQPSTCLVWCLLDELTPFQIGGESPGGKCQNIIGRVTLLSYLGAWILWKHRSSCVFDGSAPSIHYTDRTTGLQR